MLVNYAQALMLFTFLSCFQSPDTESPRDQNNSITTEGSRQTTVPRPAGEVTLPSGTVITRSPDGGVIAIGSKENLERHIEYLKRQIKQLGGAFHENATKEELTAILRQLKPSIEEGRNQRLIDAGERKRLSNFAKTGKVHQTESVSPSNPALPSPNPERHWVNPHTRNGRPIDGYLRTNPNHTTTDNFEFTGKDNGILEYEIMRNNAQYSSFEAPSAPTHNPSARLYASYVLISAALVLLVFWVRKITNIPRRHKVN